MDTRHLVSAIVRQTTVLIAQLATEYAGRLMLFGTPIEGAHDTKLGAAYDRQTDAWQELAASEKQGYQVWWAGARFYLNPHSRPTASDVFDEGVAEAPNHGLLVFGGQTWTGDEGQLINQVWLWSPPPPR